VVIPQKLMTLLWLQLFSLHRKTGKGGGGKKTKQKTMIQEHCKTKIVYESKGWQSSAKKR